MTVVGVVTVSRYQPAKRTMRRRGRVVPAPVHVITSVWVDDPTAPRRDGNRQSWMIQAPNRAWPDAARCEGHQVRVTATFRPYPIGARALRARVECADEAEHVMAALTR